MTHAIALIAGLLFGLGLTLSGMVNPHKVLNFLDLAGVWDPSLALVMGGALAITTPGFWLLRRRARACNGQALPAPVDRRIDKRLLVGSALFGIGWGLAGYCPGPAIGSLAFILQSLTNGTAHGFPALGLICFIAAMLAGSQLARRVLGSKAG
ncbi:hypothetical protein CO614_02875 [Lysobacteraceae bacterium NML120232]|nr:hypothetical protein CO608_05885 [Xanthomonadaceae bacterium NML08-0793]PJK13002.1 hypothetical protein CO614_02875 [Xanthomonadaceae bacterium NML120232]